MLWVCYMIICRRYCSIGLEHHGVGLFCDRRQKRSGPVVLVCMASSLKYFPVLDICSYGHRSDKPDTKNEDEEEREKTT